MTCSIRKPTASFRKPHAEHRKTGVKPFNHAISNTVKKAALNAGEHGKSVAERDTVVNP
jgi:hypothetical protein